MIYWAELDNNNVVIQVLTTDDSDINEGYDWLVENLGGKWVKTAVDGSIRKNFAGIGYVYDENRNAFIPPKPFNSWILNEEKCIWEAPFPSPENTDTVYHIWNEASQKWIPVTLDS